jgi:hypothetical protein
MAWAFRRGLNFGPFRINLSRKGVGFSIGARGFRVGRDANRHQYTQISLPGTGIYRRDYYSSSPQPNQGRTGRRYLPFKYLMFLMTLALMLWVILKLLK